MNLYEKQYRKLIANGAITWADQGYHRAKNSRKKSFAGSRYINFYLSLMRQYLKWDVLMGQWLHNLSLNKDILCRVWIFLKPLSGGLKSVFNKRVVR